MHRPPSRNLLFISQALVLKAGRRFLRRYFCARDIRIPEPLTPFSIQTQGSCAPPPIENFRFYFPSPGSEGGEPFFTVRSDFLPWRLRRSNRWIFGLARGLTGFSDFDNFDFLQSKGGAIAASLYGIGSLFLVVELLCVCTLFDSRLPFFIVTLSWAN